MLPQLDQILLQICFTTNKIGSATRKIGFMKGMPRAKSSEWKRFRDGLWLPQRKRTYLYWFKFLQEAELSDTHVVDWSKYSGWGGTESIVGQKFDPWWEAHWKTLFAVKSRGAPKVECPFPLSTSQPKMEAIRIALLVWRCRNAGLNLPPGSARPKNARNSEAIANAVLRLEKRKATPLMGITPIRNGRDGILTSEAQSRVGRYLTKAEMILANVCEGRFP
jgi:hypothetical protein